MLKVYVEPFISDFVNFFNIRFNTLSKPKVVSEPKINFSIRHILNKVGIRSVNQLDSEIVTVFRQKGRYSFTLIEKCSTLNTGQCILAVSVNKELVYLSGDLIHQVYIPGPWENKLYALANLI